jgi:hypothetical protein
MIDLSSRARSAAYWLTVSLLALAPLTFITAFYRTYSLPRFALLLVGSVVLLTLLLVIAALGVNLAVLKSPLTAVVCLYVLSVAVSSIFGVAPYVSLLGSFENQMGLLTHLCFFVCFAALATGIGSSTSRLRYVLWAMAGSGLLTSIYAVAPSLSQRAQTRSCPPGFTRSAPEQNPWSVPSGRSGTPIFWATFCCTLLRFARDWPLPRVTAPGGYHFFSRRGPPPWLLIE